MVLRFALIPLILAGALAGCAAPQGLAFRDTQQRLSRIAQPGPAGAYSLAKAQCWLETAWAQHSENDRTGYVEDALAEAARIARALEADRNSAAGLETPLPASATRLREDLWSKLAGFRAKTAASSCAAATVACAEVRLVRAGHAHAQTGWRGAGVHIAMVEDAVERATAQEAQCRPAAAAAAAGAPAPQSPQAPSVEAASAAAAKAPQTFTLYTDTLFRFDGAGPGDILAGGAQHLKDLAEKLKPYPAIRSIRIEGHTDRLGSPPYNQALSQARADTVKTILEGHGVRATRIEAVGMGERSPVTRNDDCSARLLRRALISCLQPDRRVTVEVNASAP